MFEPDKIKGIIFDYGGTIDSNGLHWAEVIWMSYEAHRIPVGKEDFRNAYVFGERTLAKHRIVLPKHNFHDMLRLKAELQIQWLIAHHLLTDTSTERYVAGIADWCYAFAKKAIDNTRSIIRGLSEKYPLVLVSNFYGNIESVLNDFELDPYFIAIVESAVVGLRKPDPAIFELGIQKLHLKADEIVVIGDSYEKDIVPATALGCQSIWLKSIGWSAYKGDEKADIVITDFAQLDAIFALQS